MKRGHKEYSFNRTRGGSKRRGKFIKVKQNIRNNTGPKARNIGNSRGGKKRRKRIGIPAAGGDSKRKNPYGNGASQTTSKLGSLGKSTLGTHLGY